MLDVGRKFFTVEYLKDYIRFLSYYKMNSFHLHLNDNKPNARSTSDYSAFRLKTDNPALSGLAAKDGSYTKADWEELEKTAALYGVTILPELDSPAHALAFTTFKPELKLGNYPDQLNLKNPETLEFMKSVFKEFAPWFKNPQVHIGADEYSGNPVDYITYINALDDYLGTLGKKTRVWGSLTEMNLSGRVMNEDIMVDAWNTKWYSAGKSIRDGFYTNNAHEGNYIVPFGKFYFNPHGLNNKYIYTQWTPENIEYYHLASQRIDPKDKPTARGPKLRGAKLAVWNDKATLGVSYSQAYVHKLIQTTIGVYGQKLWSTSDPLPANYDSFAETLRILGVGPNVTTITNTTPFVGKTKNVALGKPARASSIYKDFVAAGLTDDSDDTRWAAATPKNNDWVYVDLERIYPIAKVVIKWERSFGKDYDIQVSDDAKTWKTVAQRRGRETSRPDEIVLTKPQVGRYVKMKGITIGHRFGYSIWSFEVYPAVIKPQANLVAKKP